MSFTANEIREMFLSFFEEKGHRRCRSYPLVPPGDPTLYFTNAGMVQFKDVFTGAKVLDFKRATTAQKCLRVAGKHNDLEEVGVTTRHHTMFEMLGNFSFGDYFKNEVIPWAWELLTERYKLDPNRLYATVFAGEGDIPRDTEAEHIWRDVIGLPAERVLFFGAKDNFWSMGETGPCGPCSEILYDQGPGVVPCNNPHCDPTCDCGRYLEIWNLVFMQFNRNEKGEMQPLPRPSIDTGLGLERIAAILQGEHSNFHSDIFMPLINKVAELAGKSYGRSQSADDISMRVIADHSRATTFLIADGVLPSNEGRGYVLRRIMRRAIRHAHRLGIKELFMAVMAEEVARQMGDVYEELTKNLSFVKEVVNAEEKAFRKTIDNGLKLLGKAVEEARASGRDILDGATIFKLYDTYGFPMDLTRVIAAEEKMHLDEAGFEKEMEAQRKRAGAFKSTQATAEIYQALSRALGKIEFIGYPHESKPLNERKEQWERRTVSDKSYIGSKSQIAAILHESQLSQDAAISAGERFEVVVSPAPFYGESGGQVGDIGYIWLKEAAEPTLKVINTIKPVEGLIIAQVEALTACELTVGTAVFAAYDEDRRLRIRAHHSGTHLLQGGLQHILGDHVRQSGSMVSDERLRFDYSHFSQPTNEQLAAVEDFVMARAATPHEVVTEVLPYDEAAKKGAMMLFGEKYGDVVRVVTMADSMEFCGGTHVASTKEVAPLIIIKDEALSAGVRRIEALAGAAARDKVAFYHDWLYNVLVKAMGGASQPKEVDGGEGQLSAIRAAVEKLRQRGEELSGNLAGLIDQEVAVLSAEKMSAAAPDEVLKIWRADRQLLQELQQILNGKVNELDSALDALENDNPLAKSLLKVLVTLRKLVNTGEELLKQKAAAAADNLADDLLAKAEKVGDITIVSGRVDQIGAGELRNLADQIRSKNDKVILCLVRKADKVNILVALSAALTKEYNSGKIVGELAAIVGGRGGGKPDLAQAGGSDVTKADEIIPAFLQIVKK